MVIISNFMELWFSEASPFQDVLVAVFLSILFIIINYFNQDTCKKVAQEVNLRINEGALNMGIHYDYKSTRGDKAMKKEAKRKARIEERRAKRSTVTKRV